MLPLEILYEDNHLLAVNKPAELPTMGVAADKPSLLTLAKDYIRKKYAKPGNVYLGIVSRLDAPVTGVVLIARTSKAAKRLNKQFRTRDVIKTYWTICEGEVTPVEAKLVHFIRKDERHRKVHVTNADAEGAQEARLSYKQRWYRKSQDDSWLEIALETGRKHQIRVQLAKIGHPIVGDRKYGSKVTFPKGIALHSRQLILTHPVRQKPLTIIAPLPTTWKRFGILDIDK